MVLGNSDRVFRQAKTQRLSTDLPAQNVLSRYQIHCDVNVFERRRKDIFRCNISLVPIYADRKLAGFLGRLDDAGTCAACRVVDDITAVGEHLVGNTLALGCIGEALRVLGADSHVFAKDAVGVGDARLVAVLELTDDVTRDTADETDLLGLTHGCRDIADHEGGLFRAEDDARHVGR